MDILKYIHVFQFKIHLCVYLKYIYSHEEMVIEFFNIFTKGFPQHRVY